MLYNNDDFIDHFELCKTSYLLAGKKWGMKGCPSLSWSARYKVAVGIAESVGYLHNGTGRCVVHRDIKPSNILLSSRMTPKVRKGSTPQ